MKPSLIFRIFAAAYITCIFPCLGVWFAYSNAISDQELFAALCGVGIVIVQGVIMRDVLRPFVKRIIEDLRQLWMDRELEKHRREKKKR